MRLMAVAYKANRFGSAQKAMKVADPIVLSPALPRFLSPGDSLSMSITAFNTTERGTSLDFGVTTVGGLVLRGKPESLQLAPNQERFVTVGLRATNQIGAASVAVQTTAWGEKIETTTDLPVRPTAPFATDAFTGFVDGGKSVSHTVNDVYLSYGRRAHLSLSPYPVVNFAKDLKSLLGYPHGCVEQTVSSLLPCREA